MSKSCVLLCSIPVGVKATEPVKAMVDYSTKYGFMSSDPWSFECRACGLDWEGSASVDLKKVSCSNCYSDDVVMTEIRVEP